MTPVIVAVSVPVFLVRCEVRTSFPVASVFPDPVPETTPDHCMDTVAPTTGRFKRSITIIVAVTVAPLFAVVDERVKLETSASKSGLARTAMATVADVLAPELSVTVSFAV